MHDKTKWPEWLKDAAISDDAEIEITGSGRVIFKHGVWRGGVWRGGEWRGGYESCIGRCKWCIAIKKDIIRIGCKEKNVTDWDAWFASDDVFETQRDSEQFPLILQSYKNAKAVVLAQGEK